MSVYIKNGDTEYRDIKSISFAPELDPKIETLPICQFEADIVTDVPPEDFTGDFVDLHEDMGYGETATNTLLAGMYEVYEAEQVGRGVVRVKARSLVGWLEKRTLNAEYFQSVPLRTFIGRLFTDLPMNDGEPTWHETDDGLPFDIDSTPYYRDVTGFCPVQTARERLQWIAQALMLYVVQYGARSDVGLYITKSPDYLIDWRDRKSKIALPENTYRKPIIKRVSGYNAATLYYYGPFSNSEIKAEDWTSSTLRREWDLTEEKWIDVPIYYKFGSSSFNDGTGTLGSVVEIKDNTLFYHTDKNYLNYSAAPYFRKYEAEVEILQIKEDGENDTYAWPGDLVRFYADPDTIYEGIVKSATFAFGALTKTRLVISTDYVPVEVSYVQLVFRFGVDETGFARRRYTLPTGYTTYHDIYITNPPCYYMKDGKVEIIKPKAQRTRLSNSGATGTTATQYVSYRNPMI